MFKILHIPTAKYVVDSKYWLEDYEYMPKYKIDSAYRTSVGIIYFYTNPDAEKFLSRFTHFRLYDKNTNKNEVTGILLLKPLQKKYEDEVIKVKNDVEFMIVEVDDV